MDTQNDAASQVEGTGLGTPEPEDEEQYFIRLDTRKWAEELSRLEKEDPNGFRNVFQSRVGSRAADKHLPRIREMELELEAERRERKRAQMLAMSKEEVETRYANDQAFARDWTELVVHANPDEIDARREFLRATQRVETMFNRARDRGLSEEAIDGLKRDLAGGRFDKDENGRPITWGEGGFDLFQDALNDLVLDHGSRRHQSQEEEEDSAPPTKRAQATASSGNPTLTRGGPDSSPSNNASVGRRKVYRTQQQVDKDLYYGKISAADARRELAKGLPYS